MAAAKKTAKKATKKATKKTAKKAPAKKATKKGAKKATKKTGKKASAAGSVVVTSKVRERLRSDNARMSSEFVDALNGEVDELVARAIKRAQDNGRSTVRPQDL